MAKVTILKTNDGIYAMGGFQCSNGHWFDAEGCYKYCNSNELKTDFAKSHQAFKLKASATLLTSNEKTSEDWYKNRENFIDSEINFECNQSYKLDVNNI